MKENKLKTYSVPFIQKTLHDLGADAKNPLANMSNFDLWNNFKSGDEASFIFIYKKYFPKLFQFGNQFTSRAGLVEDSIQDLFIELREKREKITIKRSIKFYGFTTNLMK
ncbi:MAG: hypothetical protein ACI9GZ_003821 [Bacteroidia bacterium]